jgi:xyloglucan-specific exo-beta-1,4-glucanase
LQTKKSESCNVKTTVWRLLGAVLSIAAAAGAHAQAYRWGNVAFGGGGYVSGVVASKTERNLFYARTDVGGVYRWDAANSTWIPLMDGVSQADVGLLGIEALALDPRDSKVLYVLAGTSYFSNGKTVVMRSSNYGASFDRITDVSNLFRAHGNGHGRGNGERMQVDPGNSNVLWVGSRGHGLFKSTDAGASFKRVESLPVTTTKNEAGISFVLLDPGSVSNGAAQRIFIGVSRFGSAGANLYRSDNGGASFTAVAHAPGDHMPQRAALASDGNLYVTYGNGSGPHGDRRDELKKIEPMDKGAVWKYNVSNGTWTNVTPANVTRAFSGVSIDPSNAQRVIVSTVNAWMQQGDGWADHFFLSVNGGATWTDVVQRGFVQDPNGFSWAKGAGIHWASAIEFDPFNTKSAWVVSGNGIFRTSDIDATPTTWKFTVKGMEETVPEVAISVPGGPLLTAIGDFDGARYTDVTAYAPIHAPAIGTTTGLTVAPAKTNIVVRVGGGYQMYRSTDTGATWSKVNGVWGNKGHVVLSADGASLLHNFQNADKSYSTFRSTNYASSEAKWTWVSGLSTSSALHPVADPVNAMKFYAYDNGVLKVSTDGGASFTNAATLATGGSTRLRAAPGREGDVWVALGGNGLVRSTNSGASFTTIANVTEAQAVGFGKAASGASYPTVFIWGKVGSGPTGAYRSTDAGANWVRINDDAHQYGGPGNGNFIVGDMNTEGVVYISTAGRGLVYGAPAGAPAGGRLQARHSGKCLDVNGASTASGAAVIQWACHGGANQQWNLEDAGGGYWRVKAGHSGMCLDLASQSTANAVGLVQAKCESRSSQQWATEDAGGGVLRLKSRYSGLCVDVSGARTDDSAPIIQYTCSTSGNQLWTRN